MQTQTLWTESLDAAVEAGFDRMVQVRRHLHAYPEPSGEEQQTTRYLCDQLAEVGVDVRFGPDDRGLIVDPSPADPIDQPGVVAPRRILVRADIDALRIQDAKSVDYRSRVAGVMHACGHDAHAATVLGTCLALTAAREAGDLPWPVQWRAVFQPSEENNVGALEMIEAGVLEDVHAVLALHMDPSRRIGTIGLREGTVTADCDEMQIDVHGRGGHASRPHESIDPIAAAAQLISSIYLFVPRSIDTHEPAVVTIGHIAGGESFNVIPDHVMMRGTMRSFGGHVRAQATERIHRLARGIAEASDTRIEVRFCAGPPSVYNDPGLTALVQSCAAEIVGGQEVQDIERPSMGGEDFAQYLAHVPGCLFRLGCVGVPEGAPPLHCPGFDIDERAMAIGAKVLARAVVRWSQPGRDAAENSG